MRLAGPSKRYFASPLGVDNKCAGDAREVHHVALLLAYGAGAVNPYLAFESLHDLLRQGLLPAARGADPRLWVA